MHLSETGYVVSPIALRSCGHAGGLYYRRSATSEELRSFQVALDNRVKHDMYASEHYPNFELRGSMCLDLSDKDKVVCVPISKYMYNSNITSQHLHQILNTSESDVLLT
jgi:hypothetical protein